MGFGCVHQRTGDLSIVYLLSLMKPIASNILPIAVVMLMPACALMAQGSLTYLSYLDSRTGGAQSVASDSWLGEGFRTGTNISVLYRLDSVELLMGNAIGNPDGFSVSLYSGDQFFPVEKIADLDGPTSPASAGVYEYTASSVILSPATLYYLVVAAAVPSAIGSYRWQHVDPTDFERVSIDQWGVSTPSSFSADGQAWSRGGHIFQFAVNATVIPEPSSLALVGLAGICLAGRGLKRRVSASSVQSP